MNDGITIKFSNKSHILHFKCQILCVWPNTIDLVLFWIFHINFHALLSQMATDDRLRSFLIFHDNFITLLSQKKFIWVPNGQMRSIKIFSEFFIWIFSFFWVKKFISVPNGQMRSIKNMSDIFMSILLLCSAKWPSTIGFAVFWFFKINMSSLWSQKN